MRSRPVLGYWPLCAPLNALKPQSIELSRVTIPTIAFGGFIGALDFLVVVQDVTTGALSNSECFPARPEAENLPNGVRNPADFYFTMLSRRLLPFASGSSVRTLRNTAEPGLRAAALWLAEALLAKQESYTGLETVDPPARQWRLLKQMTAWPQRYIRHQWMDGWISIRFFITSPFDAGMAQPRKECHVER